MVEKWNDFNSTLAEYVLQGIGTVALLALAIIILSLTIAGGILLFRQIKEFFEYL